MGKFEHETTDQGWRDLRDKWDFKKCYEQKNRQEWAGRTSSAGKLPATEACYATAWDAANARHYHWELDFVKETPRMKRIINTARTMIQAGMLILMKLRVMTLEDSSRWMSNSKIMTRKLT